MKCDDCQAPLALEESLTSTHVFLGFRGWEHAVPPGLPVVRHFCPACAESFFRSADWRAVYVRAGTLTGARIAPPAAASRTRPPAGPGPGAGAGTPPP